MTDPVHDYCQSVLSGQIVAGRLVKLACQRHLDDLVTGPERGLHWDAAAAERTFGFFSCLCLPGKGELDGKPFVLEPFQQFIIGCLFGWKRADGSRRFRTAYIEQGKGNGKTPLAAGVGLKGLVGDGEVAAEVYCAATAREQARILFRDAHRMASCSPSLSSRLTIGAHNIAHAKTDSFMRPISNDHKQQSGPRPHMGLVDELHEHPSAEMVDRLRAGTKNRRQALIFEITNSGFDRDSVCYHHHTYSRQILEGLAQDDSWFAYVCQLDACEKCRAAGKDQPTEGCLDCDDWLDEACWLKVNPGLDTILPREYLREQVREAVGMPSKANIVKRLNFCIWTESATKWLNMERWDACGAEFDFGSLEGQDCYAGLDLAATTDTASLVLLFPIEPIVGPSQTPEPAYACLLFCWVPEEACRERERRNKVKLDEWVEAGLIGATPGDVIDYDRIRLFIRDELGPKFNIREIAIDRWNATQLATQLQGDGFEVVGFGQGFASMSAPTKELEALILSGRLRHGGNKVLRWMASNVSTEQDAAGNLKPSKKKSTEKIDGIVALIMALGRAMVGPESGSVYDSQGITFIGGDSTPVR